MMSTPRVDIAAGAARRRRERRLRSWLKHERMTVAMALAEASHHTAPRGQRTARAGVWGHELNFTATVRDPPTPQPELFSLYDEEPGGSRPDRMPTLSGPQERVQRHTVDQIVDAAPGLPTLDTPVPLMVEKLVDVLRFVDALVPVSEQVIEVPKIILENIPPRRLVRDSQLAEQLVTVPTPFPAHVSVPHMEDQLVEVPQTHIVPRSFFVSTDGNIWCQLRGPSGVYWWRCGTTHTQWTPPPGYTARPGRYTNTGQG